MQQVFVAVWQQYVRDFQGESDDRVTRLIMKMASLRVVDYWRRSARSKEFVVGSGEDLEMGFSDNEIARALKTSRKSGIHAQISRPQEDSRDSERRDARIRFDHGSTGEGPHTELFGGGGPRS